ncbi:acetyl-CoA carboxylase biotin carboxyl carrier protein subunit [Oceanobacillus senegalensis]|uniref:acetyl-CoA carboxylase biotin carboxyl carrier protein subunit n=1 Tax=Oceanobacillus senegalensis TaxID=1936063 RepID=UPI000A304751|nr:acetyl-CoA carboxylase biotin carboxyl carrier protein subunit [Oceanobacillus senegalensis]
MSEIKAAMAGSIWKVVAREGDQVEEGQEIVILESMKMEIPVTTEKSGTIVLMKVSEGDFVNEEDVIAIIE